MWRSWLLGLAVAAVGCSAAAAANGPLVAVVGTQIEVRAADGSTLPRDRLIGAILALRAEDGERLRVKIEEVMADPKDKTGEVLLYRFTAQDAAGAWQPICSPDPDGRQLGIAQPGAHGEVVIWCTAGALGKCVRFGYHPWGHLANGASLAPYHRACVNMVRADYIGDDHGTTRNGMLIDIYDHVGVQSLTPGRPDLRFEAAWGERGALCVAHVRVPQNISLDRLVAMAPRFAGRVGDACTEEAAATMGEPLLFNRSRGNGIPGP
jgi:hypothetical protein